uniref:WRKY transcription factor 76 n=1 Tax=Rhizophora mucronata TaxID=61149 RepID=A0A2P2QSL3_RHIMU
MNLKSIMLRRSSRFPRQQPSIFLTLLPGTRFCLH